MSVSKNIALFEDDLEGLQFAVVFNPKQGDFDLLYNGIFPRMYRNAENLKKELYEIGMFDKVYAGLSRIEELVKNGNYKEAQDHVLELNKELMESSGTAEALRRRYSNKEK